MSTQAKTKKPAPRLTADSVCTRIVTFSRDGYTKRLESQLPRPTSLEEAIREYNKQPK